MSLFASWHLVLHWGYLSKVTLVLENSSVQLEGTFLHCLDKEEEPDWVECVGVRGQRNNSSGFFFFLRIILNCLSLFQGAALNVQHVRTVPLVAFSPVTQKLVVHSLTNYIITFS